ncbi:MAG TPA: Panacea domain-containing protein [Gemmataceae bacterium]|nr:Panacea domain-containing protein [Gemmataceae bacterium]
MVFRFNVEKTIQAIAAFLHFHGSTEMSYLRLLKLLYLADRESLKEIGRPITGDRVAAMKHGPVLSGVYDLIKGEHTAWPLWSQFFRSKGYRVEMVQDPGNGRLSKYEIGKIRELTERYAEQNEWDLVEIVHRLEEWRRNDPGDSSKPISLDHILEAVGRAADREAILQDARDQAAFERLFAEEAG